MRYLFLTVVLVACSGCMQASHQQITAERTAALNASVQDVIFHDLGKATPEPSVPVLSGKPVSDVLQLAQVGGFNVDDCSETVEWAKGQKQTLLSQILQGPNMDAALTAVFDSFEYTSAASRKGKVLMPLDEFERFVEGVIYYQEFRAALLAALGVVIDACDPAGEG